MTREVTEESALVSWNKVQAEVDGYMLSYTSPDGTSQEVFVGPDNTYKMANLKPGVVYTIYVWAVKGKRASKKTSSKAETGLPLLSSIFRKCLTWGSHQYIALSVPLLIGQFIWGRAYTTSIEVSILITGFA